MIKSYRKIAIAISVVAFLSGTSQAFSAEKVDVETVQTDMGQSTSELSYSYKSET